MIVEPVPRLQSALLALFIAVIALDACPAFFRTLDRAKSAIDPLVDVTGLWQGSWQLFAPDVDKVNSRVSAEILFSDGTTVRWNSPDWTKLAPLDRFMRFREAEFYDNIRRDSNSGAWPSFADYLARRAVPPGRYDSRPAHVRALPSLGGNSPSESGYADSLRYVSRNYRDVPVLPEEL